MSTRTFSLASTHEPAFFVVAVPKLIVMTLFTSGLYGLFWYLRNWELYRQASRDRIILVLRVLWPEMFLYALLNRVDRQIRISGRCYQWSPWWLACGFSLTGVSAVYVAVMMLPMPGLASALAGLVVLSCMAMDRIQRAINFCEGDPQGEGNAQLTVVNWLWISMVTLGWLVVDCFRLPF